MNVTIIVPSLNPDEKMVNTVKGLLEYGFNDIVVVNDGSKEECVKYFEEVKELDGVSVLTHKVNKGKGRAMKTAFKYILKNRENIAGVITVDADGQHLPKDIKNCYDAMIKYGDAIVLGVRDFSLPDVPPRSKFGNTLTRTVFRLFGLKITDTQTGLRAFPLKYVKDMVRVKGERYEYETEQLLVIRDLRIKLREVIIETVYLNDNDSSHFNPVKDSIKIYKVIFKHLGRNIRRKFS